MKNSNQIVAVLIDTVSIQQYIFSSNKLKENIGASYIIEHVLFNELMCKILKIQFSEKFSDAWKQTPDTIAIENGADCEIGYIGGGNALVLFKNMDEAKKFISSVTLELLLQFPGLRTAYAIDEDFDYSKNGFKASRKRLNENLIKNKSENFCITTPYKYGIAEDCSYSNEAQEVDCKYHNKNISFYSLTKFDHGKISQSFIKENYKRIVNDKYTFTDELDELGQQQDKGYIAIVHADGNGMGQRFMRCEDLPILRRLSASVSSLADNAMTKLIEYIVNLFNDETLSEKNGFKLNETDNKKILPIRPIIVGGDDITFVCEGRLGVHLAEKLIGFMTETQIMNEPVSACAGIAVVHTKYPFYRAYTLAEELTKKAKKSSRPIPGSSWLSFLIASSGFSGSLDDIIETMFSTPNGNLYGGPYRIDTVDSLYNLKNNIKILTQGKERWPQSKLMGLRDVLRQDKASIDYFVAEFKARKRKLPENTGHSYHENLWENKKTPYYDILELKDFYPEELLD